ARLAITRNSGLPPSLSRFGEPLGVTAPIRLEAERDGRLRQRLHFVGVGLQFLDLVLAQADGLVGDRERFFTHVNRPLKLLAVGGDNRWTGAIANNRAEITVLNPVELTAATDLSDFDALVISGVAADEFSTETLHHVATQVADAGLGFMLLNGDHAGAAEENETILMSYAETPIDPALPVSVEPRPFMPEPPPRQVAFVMDVSGSMAGINLAKSQEIARYIINTFLRPQDRLDVLLFGGGDTYLIRDALMTDSNKARAIAAIDTIQAGGGSNANGAMALLERDRQLDCGLVFISDGEIVELDAVNTHPDCRATVFAIGKTSVPASSPLNELADPFPVTAEFDPAGIEIPYFKPEPRDRFFEPGDYTPLPLNRLMHISDRLPVPALPLAGTAITYLRENADLIAVRPKLTDPVLAYRAYGAGYVGVFTTAIPDAWLSAPEGQAAVTAWIERLAAYQLRDRYTFKLVDSRADLALTIALRAQ
ncbi:MAG: VWA domain-containing protein, partial [Caldilineaceae bacterium]|nr:VWA domain-containing protein [Caldilineaceae bacterium]